MGSEPAACPPLSQRWGRGVGFTEDRSPGPGPWTLQFHTSGVSEGPHSELNPSLIPASRPPPCPSPSPASSGGLPSPHTPGTQSFLPLKLGIFEIPHNAPLNFSRNYFLSSKFLSLF